MTRALTAVVVLALAACRPTPARIEVSPADVTLAVSQSAPVHVAAFDRNGAAIAASLEHPSGLDCLWSSTAPDIADVRDAALERAWRPEGVVRGVRAGSAEVVAQCGGVTARARVMVR